MNIFDEILNINNDIYGIIKVFVTISGFLALLLRLRESFSDLQRRHNLKTDFEILELAQNTNSTKTDLIKEKVETEIYYLYDKERFTSGGVLSFIIGVIVTIGFSLWTVNIYQNSEGFNPWAILTMFMSGVGISTIFDNDKKRKKKGEFFRIEFHDNENFKYGLIIGTIALISFISLIVIYKSFTWWLFVAGLFIFVGFFGTINNIKLKRIKNEN
jgi:hypothetical protein